MKELSVILTGLLPIFALILLGYCCKRAGLLNEETDLPRLNRLSYLVFMPMQMFYFVYTASGELSPEAYGRLLGFGGFWRVVLLVVCGLVVRWTVKDPRQHGTITDVAFRCNEVGIGLLLLQSMYPEFMGGACVVLIFVSIVSNVLMIAVYELTREEKGSLFHTLKATLVNPIVVATAAGALFLFARIPLPQFLLDTLSHIKNLSMPLGMILVGVSISFPIKLTPPLVGSLCARLLVIPAAMLAVAYFCGFRGAEMALWLVVFCSPPAMNAFTMSQHLGGDVRLAGNALALGYPMSFFTLLFWMVVLKAVGAM